MACPKAAASAGLGAPPAPVRALARAAAAAASGAGLCRRAAALAPRGGRAAAARALRAAAAAVVCSSELDGCVEVTLKVDGMVCDGCSGRVEEALRKAAGVRAAAVDLEKGIATVQVEAADQIAAFDALPALISMIVELGFEAQPHFPQ